MASALRERVGVQEATDGVDAAVVSAARWHVELGEDVAEVRLHGPARKEESPGDRSVGEALGDQGEDLALTRGQHAALSRTRRR
jgi:hypothetical protein